MYFCGEKSKRASFNFFYIKLNVLCVVEKKIIKINQTLHQGVSLPSVRSQVKFEFKIKISSASYDGKKNCILSQNLSFETVQKK